MLHVTVSYKEIVSDLLDMTTDYLYIVDLKKNSRCPPPARLLSPDRADMDCGIDGLYKEI